MILASYMRDEMSQSSREQTALLRRAELCVTIAIFVTVFSTPSRLATLPLRAVVKDDLGLSPEQMAEFFALIGIAWYVKPIAAVISDQIPLGGTRRKHYMMLSVLAGAVTWIATALVPLSLQSLIIAMTAINLMAVLGNTVTGGLLVDKGREHRSTGRLSALRVLAMNTGSLIAGPLGGWLASQAFPATCAVGGGSMLVMVVLVGIFLDGNAASSKSVPLPQRVAETIALLKQRRIWAVALITGLIYLAPGFWSLLYYHQRDALGFGDQSIGFLASLNCAGGMLGVFVYMRLSKRYTLRRMLIVGMFLNAACTLTYLLYDSMSSALVLEPNAGFWFLLSIMPVQELTARASPPRYEALGYALILSAGNAAIAMSDVLGTHIAASFDLDLHGMIVINAVCLVLPLLLLPLVPRPLLEKE